MKLIHVDNQKVLYLEPFDYLESGITQDAVRDSTLGRTKTFATIKAQLISE